MTVEKFYETLLLVTELDEHLNLQQQIEAIRDSLSSIASAPAQPQHQSALASALAVFDEATEKLDRILTPSQMSSIADLGGEEYFNPEISEEIRKSISSNAMTPSVARDFAQDLAKRRASFLSVTGQTSRGLQSLGVKHERLSPGQADIAFLIPRDIFDNNLEHFATELRFINRLVRDFTEATTGSVGIVELEKLSSSVPTVAIGAGIEIVAKVADVISKFLAAWQKIEEIRDVKQRLSKIGFKGQAVDELAEQITTTIEEVVEESTEFVLHSYPGEPARRNELETAIRQDTRRLFGQIERGLVVQFRAEPKEKSSEKEKGALAEIKKVNSEIFFPEVPPRPFVADL